MNALLAQAEAARAVRELRRQAKDLAVTLAKIKACDALLTSLQAQLSDACHEAVDEALEETSNEVAAEIRKFLNS